MRIAAAALVLLFVQAPGQQRPDFSGEWILVSGTGDAPVGFSTGHGAGGRMTITQSATSLTVAWASYSRSHQPVQSLVSLDGSERRFIDRNSSELQERTTRARWDGASLVITSRREGREGSADLVAIPPLETEEVLTLDLHATLKISVVRRRDGADVLRGTRMYRRQ